MRKTCFVFGWMGFLLGLAGCAHGLERREIVWQDIIGLAAERAGEPHHSGKDSLPPEYAALDYDQYRRIRFLNEHTLWAEEGLPFQVQFFHRGYLFPEAVLLSEFSRTHVQEIPFQRAFFDYDDQPLPPLRGEAAAFAGLKINAPLNEPQKYDEAVSFLGASYFRALGRGNVYGISARGLALDVAGPRAEEFPAFTEFWLQKPLGNSTRLLFYALLDSPSVTGAYRFQLTPGDPTLVEVDAVLYPRRDGLVPGLAPLTSMFWFGEHSHPRPHDYRPEVHDSDGVVLRLQGDEEIWRPLRGRAGVRHSYFRADNPLSFGLVQRDRDYRNYLDTEAGYHLRPSVLVEPRGDWGSGQLHLLELPPNGEFADNIVLSWIPDNFPPAGEAFHISYTLLWGMLPPQGALARVGETRSGRELRAPSQTRFKVEFVLPDQGAWPEDTTLDASATPPARLLEAELQPVPGDPTRLRASLLLDTPGDAAGETDLRAVLRSGGHAISEIWSYPWSP